MADLKDAIISKFKEIFTDTFYKLENSTLGTNSTLNATRNYNATTADRIITSSGLTIMTYICLILGCVGSYIFKKKQKNVSILF